MSELEQVLLVDERDRELGSQDKLTAHRNGNLHRAFSIFVHDSQGLILLQRRSATKYHSAGLWANTCCSHPRPGKSLFEEARRRLFEEMGIECALRRVGVFRYRAEVSVGMIEHELDHVLVGHSDVPPRVNAGEVSAWRRVSRGALVQELETRPEMFGPWVGPAFQLLVRAP